MKLIFLGIVFIALVGCASMEAMFDVKEESRKSLPQIGNNTTVELDGVVYTASDVRANKVKIMGKGVVLTVIRGDWRIVGNNVTVSKLTIEGNAILEGNNIVLEGLRITGSVQSTGQNNSW
ncbi:MAG: hypothetical protein RQ801_03935 [Spirochaetaceae bacterium]|nr:hypothetical protein [Spirochaetaceae bacterium]